jgi:hypothetical protein
VYNNIIQLDFSYTGSRLTDRCYIKLIWELELLVERVRDVEGDKRGKQIETREYNKGLPVLYKGILN